MSTTEDTQTTETQKRVWAAADALQTAGQRVTSRAVRTRAGVDARAVKTHLDSWHAEQEAGQEDAAAAPPVPEGVQAALHRVWGAAYAAAEATLRPALEAAEKRAATLEAQVGQLTAEADACEAELVEAQDALEAAKADARTAEAAAAAAGAQAITEEKARTRAEARAEAAETALRDFLHAQARAAEERGAAA